MPLIQQELSFVQQNLQFYVGPCHGSIQEGTAFRSGQRFANFYCTSFKTNMYSDTEGAAVYNIENYEIYISCYFLELTVCRIIKINKKVMCQ